MINALNSKAVAIIPARAGSKSVPHKNIRNVGGLPLFVWSIRHAQECSRISKVVVSSDSPQYLAIAKQYGAEAIRRPEEISGDSIGDLPVFEHALEWLEKHQDYQPGICVHLRPTYPVRQVNITELLINLLVNSPSVDSIRTVTPTEHSPYRTWFEDINGMLKPVAEIVGLEEAANLPRQAFPKTYMPNANVDVVRSRVVKSGSMEGARMQGFIETENYDINTPEELAAVARMLK